MGNYSIHRVLNFIERLSAKGLGKGFGAVSVLTEIKLLHKVLGGANLGIDIGANKGEYAAGLRANFPTMELHLFEPSKTNCDSLNTRFAANGNIIINPVALSDTTTEAKLFTNELGSGLGSLTKRNLSHFNIDFNLEEDIRLIKFSDYWESTLLKRAIDIAKMDVEGHELAVLKGFGDAIYKTGVIQFEFGGCNIDTRTYFQDFWYFFKDHSFKIYRITPLGLLPIDNYSERHESFITTNYLCVNQLHTGS